MKVMIKMWKRVCSGFVLATLTIYIFYITVFSRSYNAGVGHNFSPFWSYRAILEGREELVRENFLNVLLFIPFGLSYAFTFKDVKYWQEFLIGAIISIIIELLQFLLKRGFAEIDDVMHNVLGCILGFGIYKGLMYITRRI